jgi:solute carrier family 25 carnitine/acylcarnitine transporter 20/29
LLISLVRKVQLQTNTKYTGMVDAFTSIAKKEGVWGLYKGVQSPLAGLFFMNAVIFSAYGAARRALGETPTNPITTERLWAAGFIAGM